MFQFYLEPDHDQTQETFHCYLEGVRTLTDLFPPDSGTAGVREPRRPFPPELPDGAVACTGLISELCRRRQHRDEVMRRAEEFLIATAV